jgi:hypothetical protein
MKRDEGYTLPSLQKKILLCLAEHGSQTRNGMKQKYLKSAYKNILYSFKSLLNKGFIREVGKKSWDYPLYWLTDEGIMLSSLNGANESFLIGNVRKLLPKNDETDYLCLFIELCQIPVMRKFCELSYITSKFEGRVPLNQLSFIGQLKANSPETKRIMKVFKKYPKAYQLLKNRFEESQKRIREFDEVFKL